MGMRDPGLGLGNPTERLCPSPSSPKEELKVLDWDLGPQRVPQVTEQLLPDGAVCSVRERPPDGNAETSDSTTLRVAKQL